MAILIVNNLEQPQGLVLGERVLIGRRPFNTIMVPDPDVSRIHAWIGRRDGRYVLFDAGSRSGTLLNGAAVGGQPRALADGDEIRVGPATIVYAEGDELPSDVMPIEPAPVPPAADPYDGGIYFDCACGGPMWVTADLAGRMGKCRYCGERLVVPSKSGTMARQLSPAPVAEAPAPEQMRRRAPEMPAPSRRPAAPVPAPPRPRPTMPPAPPVPDPSARVEAAETAAALTQTADVEVRTAPTSAPVIEETESLCSICQTPIAAGEERTVCPSCHLTFHAGCWQENFGCSAYGCDQVNVLAPREPAGAGIGTDAGPTPEAPASEPADRAVTLDMDGRAPFPWQPVLLALSFIAMALGALAYGIPSAVTLVGALGYLAFGRRGRKGLVWGALVVSLIGGAAGYATSMLWWKGQRVWEMFLK